LPSELLTGDRPLDPTGGRAPTPPLYASTRSPCVAPCLTTSQNLPPPLVHRNGNDTIHHNRFTALFRNHPGEPAPEENFWTLRCKGRLTEADKLTIRLGATPSGLTSAHLHHPPIFSMGRMPFLPPKQQRQSTGGN